MADPIVPDPTPIPSGVVAKVKAFIKAKPLWVVAVIVVVVAVVVFAV